jgi:hypothetical protein
MLAKIRKWERTKVLLLELNHEQTLRKYLLEGSGAQAFFKERVFSHIFPLGPVPFPFFGKKDRTEDRGSY